MGIEIPGALQWVSSVAVGADWPQADETALWRLRDAWQAAADELADVAEEGDAAAAAVLGTIQGDVSVAFEQYWTGYTSGVGAYLPDVQQLCADLAAACDSTALDTEYTKYSIIAALVILAAQVVAMLASAVATLGASTAGIPLAQAATQLAVRQLLVRLLQEIARQVAINVGLNLAVDVAIQGGQQLHSGDQDWDWGKTGEAVVSGIAAGVAGGAVGVGAGNFLGTATRTFGGAAARGAAEGAASGVLGNTLNAWMHGQASAGLQGTLSGAVAGGVSGSLDGTTNRHGGLDRTMTGNTHTGYTVGPNSSGWPHQTPGGSTVTSNPAPAYNGSPLNSSSKIQDLPSTGLNNVSGVSEEGDGVPPADVPSPVPSLNLPDPG